MDNVIYDIYILFIINNILNLPILFYIYYRDNLSLFNIQNINNTIKNLLLLFITYIYSINCGIIYNLSNDNLSNDNLINCYHSNITIDDINNDISYYVCNLILYLLFILIIIFSFYKIYKLNNYSNLEIEQNDNNIIP
jgi:hypothetical protein